METGEFTLLISLSKKRKNNGAVVGGGHGVKRGTYFVKMEEIIVYLYVNWNNPRRGRNP